MRFAYADPPYLGCCKLYGHRHEAPYECWDLLSTYRQLIERLNIEFSDGWALSSSVPAARKLERAGLLPEEARYGAWVKPFASFKPNVNPAYCWEVVVFRGGRQHGRGAEPTIRDYVSAPITLMKGLVGVKPPAFDEWVLGLLGYRDGDELIDLFPGKGGMDDILAQGSLAWH